MLLVGITKVFVDFITSKIKTVDGLVCLVTFALDAISEIQNFLKGDWLRCGRGMAVQYYLYSPTYFLAFCLCCTITIKNWFKDLLVVVYFINKTRLILI